MPLNLKHLKAETKPLEITFGDGSLSIKYRPNAFTPMFQEELARVEEEASPTESFLAMIAKLVASWDLTDEDEKGKAIPVPLDAQSLKDVPFRLLTEIASQVGDDMRPPAAPTGGSFTA